ncbi:MAG: DUF1801 domain-containing protein [Bacteroidota bacterium]
MATQKKTTDNGSAKLSETAKVDEFMKKLKHPMKDVVEALRQIIVSADKQIGEEIFWNGPTFFYTGEMKSFDPKEYKRFIVGINLFKKDCVRLVFLTGAKLNDKSGLLEGDYADGRRLALFYSMDDVKLHKKNLQHIIKTWLKLLDK